MFFLFSIISALLSLKNINTFSGNDERPFIHNDETQNVLPKIHLLLKKKELLNILQNQHISQNIKIQHIDNTDLLDVAELSNSNIIKSFNLTKGLKW